MLHYFTSGYCTANQRHILKGNPPGKAIFFAFWALVRHPECGPILFDTGYTERFTAETRAFPNRLYRAFTPLTLLPEETAVTLLKNQMGIQPEEVRYIIVSHFHADHVGGLKDFPNARFICSRRAYQHIANYPGWCSFSRGYLKGLLPADFEARAIWIESAFPAFPLTDFNAAWHWEEAGITFVDLPGHARGQVGALLVDQNVFLIADACWTIRSVLENRYPPAYIRLMIDDYPALCRTIAQLHFFHKKNPALELIPTHCEETLVRLGIV